MIRRVSELYNRHPGSDIYIVGTGTSMRVFPTSFLEGKIVIGLNMAWKLLPVQYAITIRPELNIPEFMEGETPHPEITWITKYHKLTSDAQRELVQQQAERFYNFNNHGRDDTVYIGKVVDWVRRPVEDNLYVYTSISQTAANLAANMGAKNIILIGCDNCSLMGNHHAHNQHTLWYGGATSEERYHSYYEGLVEVRTALRERGVNLVNMTPFLNLLEPDQDFTALCQELGQPLFVENKDITQQVFGANTTLFSRLIKKFKRTSKV